MKPSKKRFLISIISFVLGVLITINVSPLVLADDATSATENNTPQGGPLSYVEDPLGTTPNPGNSIALLSNEITEDAVNLSLELYNNFIAADPDLFLLEETGIKNLAFYGAMTDKELNYVKEKTLEIVNGLTTEADKIFAVAKYLAQNICYDYDYFKGKTSTTNFNAYDVLTNEYTVCSGYAVTFAAMMQLLDIPCVYVNAPDHAWNMVYCDRWMLVDVTWISGSSYRDGEKNKSDRIRMDWFDFTIEQANSNYNHTIEGLPLEILSGVLNAYPCDTITKDVVIPASVNEIGSYCFYGYNYDIANLYLPTSVTKIHDRAFQFSSIDHVYYEGTSTEFREISIGDYNSPLTTASIHYAGYHSSPVIVAQSADMVTDLTTTVSLSVEAVSSGGELSYQWYVNSVRDNQGGTPLDGATSATYQIPSSKLGTEYYYVEVSNGNTTTSRPVAVFTYEEIPSVHICLFPTDVYYIVFPVKRELWLVGNGSIDAAYEETYFSWDFDTVHIGSGITGLPEKISESDLFFFNSVSAYVVDQDNPVFSSDESGVLFNKDKTHLIQAPESLASEYTIPDSVLTIEDEAFYYCYDLNAITIPGSVSAIEECAFQGCLNLEKVHVMSGGINIGEEAFARCYSLSAMIFTDDAPRIGNEAFYGVSATIYYPADNETWTSDILQDYGGDITWVPTYNGAFASGICGGEGDGSNLTWSLSVGGALTISGQGTMKNYSFDAPWIAYRDIISTVMLETGVTSIGKLAFSVCTNLTSVMVPDSVISIGGHAFYECTGLASVMVPNSVISIGNHAFHGCTSLTSVMVPGSVTSIGKGAFCGCETLAGIHVEATNSVYSSDDFGVLFNKDKTSLVQAPGAITGTYTIPNSVTSIGDYAFSDCTGLVSVIIPDSVTSIGDYAFSNCTGLVSVIIPDSVTSIGDCAFSGCTGLASVIIPDSVASIGDDAFYGCEMLTGIHVEAANATYSSDGSGVLFNKDKTSLIQAPGGLAGTYTIPDSVTSIESSAFSDCRSLISVIVPNTVASIESYVFYGCTNLASVTLPNSVTSIGSFAFYNCGSLASVTIPDSVISIDSYAFLGCDALATIRFEGNVPVFGNGPFWGIIATAYYPSANSTWTDEAMQNYGGTFTWVPSGGARIKSNTCTETGSSITIFYDHEAAETITCYFALYDTEDRFLRLETLTEQTIANGSINMSISYTAEEEIGRIAAFVVDSATHRPLCQYLSQAPGSGIE